MTRPTIARIVRVVLDRFLLLPIGAIIALVWANTAAEGYFTFAQQWTFAVNEIGMAFFFALLAQEVLEAMMPGGSLHSWRRWMMPLVAAAGGMIGAIAVYLALVHLQYEDGYASVWPIACAVDIAATYYVLKSLLPHSPALPFVLLVAIVTDAVGLVIVAPQHVIVEARVGGAAMMLTALGLAALLRALRVRRFWPYLFGCGAISWLAFYRAGLHPAFALIPIVPFLRHEARHGEVLADPPDNDAVHHAEHEWHVIVQIVVFLFGLVNGGVILKSYDTASWAMISAALVGRPAGMLVAVALALLVGLHLPRRLGWRELLVVSLAASNGFAIALFFATGMVAAGPVLAQAKVGVLGSVAGLALAYGAARLLRVGKMAH